MDDSRFDAVTRSLSSCKSRRSAIWSVAAGLVGGVVPALGRDAAAGACRAPGRDCKRNEQCCSNSCNRHKGRCRGCSAGQKFCKADSACIDGSACCGVCPAGQECCANLGRCIETRDDRDHCGGCTTSCALGAICVNGACAETCSGSGVDQCTDCGCFNRLRNGQLGAKTCADFGFTDCDTAPACSSDADCGFGEGCYAACPGKRVCLVPCE